GKVLLWDPVGGKVRHTLAAGGVVRALVVAPGGKVVASGGDDAVVHLWDAAGKPLQNLVGATDWLMALAFSPDGERVAAGGYDGLVRVWEVGTGKKLYEVPSQPPAPPNSERFANVIASLAFSPDG